MVKKKSGIPAIKDVMTPLPRTIGFDQDLQVARYLMRSHQIRYLPVLRDGEAIGVVTSSDLGRRQYLGGDSTVKVGDLCCRKPLIVSPDARVDSVIRRMLVSRNRCALVIQDDRLVGLFTSKDAYRSFARFLRAERMDVDERRFPVTSHGRTSTSRETRDWWRGEGGRGGRVKAA